MVKIASLTISTRVNRRLARSRFSGQDLSLISRWEGLGGKYSYQLLPAGSVLLEFQKFGTKMPMDPDMEKVLLGALKKVEVRKNA
jgi:hypothetical protein